MEWEGIVVKHKAFGKGIIKMKKGNYITVFFSQGDKKFIYPDAFKTFLTAVDDKIADDIQKDIRNIEEKSIILQKEKTSDFVQTRVNETIPPFHKEGKKALDKIEIASSSRQYFFVFQNKSFDAECRGGYLWAPKSNKTGHKISHWLMMEQVHKGDIIFHSINKSIKAVSIALSDCYSADQPEELKREQMWEDDGYRVDCQYIHICNPIITSDYMDTILELQPGKYAPFNSLGRGNTGYLFASNRELSQFLLDKLLKANMYLQECAEAFGLNNLGK